MDSVNDYNLDGGNESKFHEDIIQTSEKRSKFDVVSVGLVASTNLNGNFIFAIIYNFFAESFIRVTNEYKINQ